MTSDPVKKMMAAVQTVLSATDLNTKQEALDDVIEFCDDLDLAADLQKAGGYSFIAQLMSSGAPGLRWRAAELLGAMTQNNEVCQKEAVEAGLVVKVMQMIDREGEEPTVRAKAMHALSCMIREFPVGQRVFLAHDGLSVMIRAMQRQDEERLQTKAAFLLAALCSQGPQDVVASAPTQAPPTSQAPPPFVASHEFQTLLPGQSVPPGLHVRMNLATGQREAKIADSGAAGEGGRELALVEGEGPRSPQEAESSSQGAGSSSQGAGSSSQGAGSSSQGAGSSSQGEGSSSQGERSSSQGAGHQGGGERAGTWEEQQQNTNSSESATADNIAFALCQMGCVEQLVGMVRSSQHAAYHEHLMRALLSLVTAGPASAAAECRRPELQLRITLEERMSLLEGREEYREELEHAAALYQKCFCGNMESAPDR